MLDVLLAVKEGYVPDDGKGANDKEHVWSVLRKEGFNQWSLAMQEIGSELKQDLAAYKEIALFILEHDGDALRFAGEALQNDKDAALAAVKQNGEALRHVGKELQKDKEAYRDIVMAAVRQTGNALFWCTDNALKNDKDVVMASLEGERPLTFENASLDYIGDALQQDAAAYKEIITAAARKNGEVALYYAGSTVDTIAGRFDSALRNDKELVLAAVKNNGMALRHIGATLKADKETYREIAIAAVKQNSQALKHAGELRDDQAVVLAAMDPRKEDGRIDGQAGWAVAHASEKMRADPLVILMAMACNDTVPQRDGVSVAKYSRLTQQQWQAIAQTYAEAKGLPLPTEEEETLIRRLPSDDYHRMPRQDEFKEFSSYCWNKDAKTPMEHCGKPVVAIAAMGQSFYAAKYSYLKGENWLEIADTYAAVMAQQTPTPEVKATKAVVSKGAKSHDAFIV